MARTKTKSEYASMNAGRDAPKAKNGVKKKKSDEDSTSAKRKTARKVAKKKSKKSKA